MLSPNQFQRALNRFHDIMNRLPYVKTRKFWYETTQRTCEWYDRFRGLNEAEQMEAMEIIFLHQSKFVRECIAAKEPVIRCYGLGQFWINPIRAFMIEKGYGKQRLTRQEINSLLHTEFGRNFKVNKLTGNIIVQDPFEHED